MKLITVFKNNRLLLLAAMVMMVFGVTLFSMKRPASALQGPLQEQAPQSQQQQEGKYFIYGNEGIENGIWVDKEFVKKNSASLAAMLEDSGDINDQIPLNASISTIQLAFNILANKVDVRNYSLQDMVAVANLFNFLDVPKDKLMLVSGFIKILIDKSSDTIFSNEILSELHPDLQKWLMVGSVTDYLKKSIIKKYVQERKKELTPYPGMKFIEALAMSSDATKIIAGGLGNEHNLVLWNISNPNNITYKELEGHIADVTAVAFSNDNRKIISGSADGALIVWDISNPNNIAKQELISDQKYIYCVALSPDSKKLASGSSIDKFNITSDKNNLVLWDISNFNDITHQQLVGHQEGVYSVAFSLDSKKLVSGSFGNQQNLMVWDISNTKNITKQELVGVSERVSSSVAFGFAIGDRYVLSVAFSPDGKMIIATYGELLILWDISNPQNIKRYLLDCPDYIDSVAFSPDGKNIVSGGQTLILWDIRNLNNITHQKLLGHSGDVIFTFFSADGTKMLSGSEKVILWTLLTDQEKLLLNELKNYNVDQIRLIYQLCLETAKGRFVLPQRGSSESAVFMTLPTEMRKLLNDLFFIKSFNIKMG